MYGLALVGLAVPDWTLQWVAMAAAVGWLVGARRAAISLLLFLAFALIGEPLLRPWFMTQPLWLRAAISALAVLLLVHGAVALLFGRGPADYVVQVWLVRIGDALLLGPLRAVRGLLRLIGGLW